MDVSGTQRILFYAADDLLSATEHQSSIKILTQTVTEHAATVSCLWWMHFFDAPKSVLHCNLLSTSRSERPTLHINERQSSQKNGGEKMHSHAVESDKSDYAWTKKQS